MKIIILPAFKRQLKFHLKKFRDLKDAVIFCLENFNKDKAVSLGKGIYKIRLNVKALKRGKSNSFRLLILLLEKDGFLVPISIFFKGDKENLSPKEISDYLEKALNDLRMGDL